MKLVIIKSHLKEALSGISGATGENQNLPILKNVLIEAKEGGITLTATNLEIAVRYAVSGKVIEQGTITVPLAPFLTIIVNLESERLNIEAKGQALEITTDNYHATLQGLAPDDFPLIPKLKSEGEPLVFEGGVLKDALSKVVFSAQSSDFQPELGTVLMMHSIDNLKFVATDGFRLAEQTLSKNHFSTKNEERFRILVPAKTIQELLKIIGDREVTLFHDATQILFKTETFYLISRLIEGNFPAYEAIIPKEFGSEVLVNAEEFANAVKLSGVFGTRVNEIKVCIPHGGKRIEISSAEQGVGDNVYTLPAKTEGTPREVSFNWRYLLDGIKALHSEEIFLGLNKEENKAALVRSPHDGNYFYLVMPILKA